MGVYENLVYPNVDCLFFGCCVRIVSQGFSVNAVGEVLTGPEIRDNAAPVNRTRDQVLHGK
jgi:hypothetical protein